MCYGRKLVVNDLENFCANLFAAPIISNDYTAIVIPTEKVLWEFVHRTTAIAVTVAVPENPAHIYRIQAARRGQKMRHYMYTKLEALYAMTQAGLVGWDPIAIARAMGTFDGEMKSLARIEDELLVELKSIMAADEQQNVNEIIRVFDEGWLKLAGVPIGRTLLADIFKRSVDWDEGKNGPWNPFNYKANVN